MSNLFLMRHSFAQAGDFQTPDDARSLTPHGREAARIAAEALHSYVSKNLKQDMASLRIVASPLVRTMQSAEILAAIFGYKHQIFALQELRSETSPKRALQKLHNLLGENLLLAVTHEPLISSMNALLSSKQEHQNFQPSEIAHFREGKHLWRHLVES